MTILEGQLVHGLGRAKQLTQLDWVRRQLIELTGIDPHPGTLNLQLLDDANRDVWRRWCELPGEIVVPEDVACCRAHCYSVTIEGKVPAAIIRPDSADYPPDKVELIAALPVREHLQLADNARIRVELCQPLFAEAILFDLDGTLVDSVGAYLEVARVAAQPFGLEVTEQHVRNCLAVGKNFWKGVVPQDRGDCDSVAKAMSAHAAREWPRVLREHGTVFDGVARTLAALRGLGIKLGVVSGARPEVLELLGAEGILEQFDTVILGPDVSRGKPDPEGICKGLRRLGVRPEMALYVGDAPVDIQASRAAGVRAVSVLTGAAGSAMLSAYAPDRLISSHARLPGIMAPARA